MKHSSTDIHPDWIRDYQNGVRVRDIAKKAGVTPQAIYLHFGKHEVPTQSRTVDHKFSKQTIKQCIDLYESGRNIVSIGNDLGISRHSISEILHYKRIPVRNRNHVRQGTLGEIFYNHRLAGMKWREIGEKYPKNGKPRREVIAIHIAKQYAYNRGRDWPIRLTKGMPKTKTKKCARLYQSGKSYREISEIMNCPVSMIVIALAEQQVPVRVSSRLHDASGIGKQAYDLRAKLMPWQKIKATIEKKANVSKATTAYIQAARMHALRNEKTWPITNKNRQKLPTIRRRIDAIAVCYKEGDSIAEIAKKFRITQSKTREILQYGNVTLRKPGAPKHPLKQGKLIYAMRAKGIPWEKIADTISIPEYRLNPRRAAKIARSYAFETQSPYPISTNRKRK